MRTLFLIISLSFGLAGCASLQPYTAPGIQPPEARVLTTSYYWRRGVDPEQFSDAEIQHLFDRTREIPLDEPGERSELLCSQLVWALAAAGDTRFAALLSRQPREVQLAVLHYVSSLWTHDHLHYPATEALSTATDSPNNALQRTQAGGRASSVSNA